MPQCWFTLVACDVKERVLLDFGCILVLNFKPAIGTPAMSYTSVKVRPAAVYLHCKLQGDGWAVQSDTNPVNLSTSSSVAVSAPEPAAAWNASKCRSRGIKILLCVGEPLQEGAHRRSCSVFIVTCECSQEKWWVCCSSSKSFCLKVKQQ